MHAIRLRDLDSAIRMNQAQSQGSAWDFDSNSLTVNPQILTPSENACVPNERKVHTEEHPERDLSA